MLLRQEIINSLRRLGPDGLARAVFGDLELADAEKRDLLSSVCSGHHLFILGPPGSGKTSVAANLWSVLGDIEVVDGCPLNCSPADAACPWCLERKARGETLRGVTLPAARRMVKVQGSGGLMVEDLIGDLDPEAALRKGVYSAEAFLPGKLLAANRGILLIDFVDRVPERVLNVIMYAVQGGSYAFGRRGATNQAGSGTFTRRDGEHALRPRRTDQRSTCRRYSQTPRSPFSPR